MASSTRRKRAALRELCWFDSNPMHQSMVSVVQSVRTPDCDSGGRGFEPRPSPQVPSPARFRDPRSPWRAGSRAGGGQIDHAPIAQLDQSAGLRIRRFEVRVLVGAPSIRGRRQAAKGTGLSSRHSRVRIPSSAPTFASIVQRRGYWPLKPETRVRIPLDAPPTGWMAERLKAPRC